MKTRNLFSCLVAVTLAFVAAPCSGQDQPEELVDLGVRVISSVDPTTGTVTTLWAGTADAILAYGDDASGVDGDGAAKTISQVGKTADNAKPLYFATGNLIVSKSGTGRIGSPTEVITFADYKDDATDSERDLFGWADPTGWDTSTDMKTHYPARASGAVVPEHISGNPLYDIARATIGGAWRLPTAAELAVLMQQIAADPISTSQNWKQGSYGNGKTGTAWSSSTPIGLTIYSKVPGFTTSSIFIPAAGRRDGTGVDYRDKRGYVWSGTLNASNPYFAHILYFYSGNWYMYYINRYYGLSVRPVSE